MTITKTINGNDAVLALAGRLDTVTSIKLSDEIENVFSAGKFNLFIDMKDIEYMSSAGLRVIFAAQKKVTEIGTKLEISGVNDVVKNVFDVTGFSGFLNIK